MFDGKNIQTGRTSGTIIGTDGYTSATDQGQKVGFFGKAPIVQPAHIASPAGGGTVDNESRAAINSILSNVLELLGLTRLS